MHFSSKISRGYSDMLGYLIRLRRSDALSARYRFIVKRIAAQSEQDLLIAIEVQSIHIKGAYDPIVSDALDNTIEAWGHGTVLRSVFAEQVIALIRLWDDRGDVLSLPRAESIFQAPGFVGNFVDMEAPHRGGHEALQERKEMIRMQIAEFQRKYRQAKGDHTLARLRNIRNETLAHNAEAPVGQRAEYDHHDLSLVKALLSDFGNSGMQDGRSFNWV
tara:strand:- start:532 stop:1185 length:654 start_codon:yes stop_codon:yes gene_type:complete